MRHFKSYLAIAFALGLTAAGCTRESSRIGEGDVATNAFTGQNSETSTPPNNQGAQQGGGGIGSATGPATEGQPQVGEKQGVPTGNPQVQPSTAGKIGGEPIDLNQYPFAKKDEFKASMNTRLQAVDQALGTMKTSQATSPQASATLQVLEKKTSHLEGELKTVDSVPAQNWDSFKSKFRDQIVSLEKSYNDVVAAKR